MKEIFIPQRFAAKSEILLKKIDGILERFNALGMSISVRQLYYQLVTVNAIPNSYGDYKRIIALVSDARLAGRIDWEAIVDRNRRAERPDNWEDAAAAVRWVAEQFQLDKWCDQDYHVEVMVEKDALSGVLSPVCSELDVTFSANKGYSSSSAIYRAANRLAHYQSRGKKILVAYLGDHDPSGIDMTRDIFDRLGLFSRNRPMTVERLALNIDQVRQYNPPENPTKETDSRTTGYVAEFGESCWELDALDPEVLANLLRASILAVRDETKWAVQLAREAELVLELRASAEELGTRAIRDGFAELREGYDSAETMLNAQRNRIADLQNALDDLKKKSVGKPTIPKPTDRLAEKARKERERYWRKKNASSLSSSTTPNPEK